MFCCFPQLLAAFNILQLSPLDERPEIQRSERQVAEKTKTLVCRALICSTHESLLA